MPRKRKRKPATRRRLGSRRRSSRAWLRLPSARTRQRWLRLALALPLSVHIAVGALLLGGLWFVANGAYQFARKPSELFFPVSEVLHKTPAETWAAYGRLFERHSTAMITPAFLAALAQVEGSGNPIVRTYWRWAWRSQPFEIYRPASSAVGMYQITDGTFAQARRYCIRDNRVIADGPWHDWRSCWFNALYTRTIPSHAIEMTSAYLDVQVRRILERHRLAAATPSQKLALAAVIHLCGAGAGSSYARRGLRLLPAQRCGDHDVKRYLEKVERMHMQFAGLRAGR